MPIFQIIPLGFVINLNFNRFLTFLCCYIFLLGHCAVYSKTPLNSYPEYALSIIVTSERGDSEANSRAKESTKATVDGVKLEIFLRNGVVLAYLDDSRYSKPLAWSSALTEKLRSWVISPHGDVWIVGSEHQYVAKLKYANQKLSIENIKKLPAIYSAPCNIANRLNRILDNGCPLARPSYSLALGRGFISGFQYSIFGEKPIILESSVASGVKLHKGWRNIVLDAPGIRGVVIEGSKHKPIFYDGNKEIELFPPDWHAELGKNESGISSFGWFASHAKIAERYVVGSLKHTNRNIKPIFLEVLPRGETSAIVVSGPLQAGMTFFAMSQISDIMGMQNDGLYANKNGVWQKIVAPQQGWHFKFLWSASYPHPFVEFSSVSQKKQIIYKIEEN